MLIVLGGFYGSGRTIFSRKLAKRHQLHPYDMEAMRTHGYTFLHGGSVRETTQWSQDDRQRIHLYGNVLKDFALVSKMHPDTIIEEAFHRKQAREFFLKRAAEFFKPVVFVWIDSDESHVEKRLRRMVARGLAESVTKGMERRKAAMSAFDGLDPEERVFKCVRGDDAEVDALWTLVQSA